MLITKASLVDIEGVANLHEIAFSGFFLTSLGNYFLKEMYRGYLLNSSGILLVAKVDNSVVGFAAGSAGPRESFAFLRFKHALKLLFWSLPAVIKNPTAVGKKLIFILRRKKSKLEMGASNALLSSIGVSPSAMGKNIAQNLIEEFELIARSRLSEYIYLTTDSLDNGRAVGFYSKNGYLLEREFYQSQDRLMSLFFKKL